MVCREPLQMMLQQAGANYSIIEVEILPAFPTVWINRKKISRPSEALKSLGTSLGYEITAADDLVIASFVQFRAYASKN